MPKMRFLKFYCLNVRFLFRFLGHSIAKQRSFMCVLSGKVMNNQISYFSKSFLTLHAINRGKKKQKKESRNSRNITMTVHICMHEILIDG